VDDASRKLLYRHWPALGRELADRTVKPAFHPSFVMFFIVAIVGVGPTGFWIELYAFVFKCQANAAALRASFVSFVPAFVAATTMQLVWAESEKRSMRAFAILVLAICMLMLVFCGSEAIDDRAGIAWGGVSTVIALWMWWIANAHQKEFQDQSAVVDNPIGGPLSGDMPPLPGADGLARFKTDTEAT
jgi:hypothetical protein